MMPSTRAIIHCSAPPCPQTVPFMLLYFAKLMHYVKVIHLKHMSSFCLKTTGNELSLDGKSCFEKLLWLLDTASRVLPLHALWCITIACKVNNWIKQKRVHERLHSARMFNGLLRHALACALAPYLSRRSVSLRGLWWKQRDESGPMIQCRCYMLIFGRDSQSHLSTQYIFNWTATSHLQDGQT